MSPTMDDEMVASGPHQPFVHNNKSKAMKITLLLLNGTMLAIGNTGGPLILRLYFIRGGNRKWLSSWLQTGGWPLILIPLSISYVHRRLKSKDNTRVFFITPFLFASCAVLGVLTGLDDYMYAYGSTYLPVSTSSILISSQLAFNAVFALLIVKHKFTPYSINAVILLMVGAIILGVHSNSDRPAKETNLHYYLGFFMTLGAAALYGVVLPLLELTYMKTKQAITYALVMEMQMVICFFATAFCTLGMLANKDFKAIPREARVYGLGESRYYMVLVGCAVFWQFFFLGMVGVISCSSSLHAGVLISAFIPVTEILAVFFYDEKFNADKGLALSLALWGFASYFYGEFKKDKKEKLAAQMEMHDKQDPQGQVT
ncbi:purine permease 3-like [Magnolia sinica]|uniref:purine permease 3-like n=1 Tax=Magnolia sinica TaxID=86752 RepID=UPI00265AE5CD|nr:purine permease 3-like [Magnolia sinica]